MTLEIPVTQARDELAELINRVAYGHERVILTRHSKPVACLVPPEDLAWLEQQGRQAIDLTSAGHAIERPVSLAAPDPLPAAARLEPHEQPRGTAPATGRRPSATGRRPPERGR
jgi:prevent-host-death family protein